MGQGLVVTIELRGLDYLIYYTCVQSEPFGQLSTLLPISHKYFLTKTTYKRQITVMDLFKGYDKSL